MEEENNDDEIPIRTRRKPERNRMYFVAAIGGSVALLVVAVLLVVFASRGGLQGGVRAVLTAKPSPTVEGERWRYEELNDYLRAKGLRFEGIPTTPIMNLKDCGYHGGLVFKNSGRNHRTVVLVTFYSADCNMRPNQKRDAGPNFFSWGRFDFEIFPDSNTNYEEQKLHFKSIRDALES